MKKSVLINLEHHNIELITNGKEEFKNIVLCFHGFGGNKWGDAYSGLKKILDNSLVCSFDSCGHGESEIVSEDMRLDVALEEIDGVVGFLKQENSDKPIILVAVSYGAYRVMQYLIKYRPEIKRVVYVNPAFKMLEVLEKVKDFKYADLKDGEKIVMKKSLNKFIKKDFLDDLLKNDLYSKKYDLGYETFVVIGTRDSLIPVEDSLEIARMYDFKVTYINEEHCFENKESWNSVAGIIEEE